MVGRLPSQKSVSADILKFDYALALSQLCHDQNERASQRGKKKYELK